jgi:hypothetical protein
MGYSGIFMDRGEYAMSNPNPYVDPPIPGATPNYNVTDATGNLRFLNDNNRTIIKAQLAADLIVWSNHEIVHRFLKENLNEAIPDKYKPALGIGQCGFGTRTIQDIFVDLYDCYGQVTQEDSKNLNLNLYMPWNASTPSKTSYSTLKHSKCLPPKPVSPSVPTPSSKQHWLASKPPSNSR